MEERRTSVLEPAWEALRSKQWIKNLFVLTPLLFARELQHPHQVLKGIAAFAIFCALSSAGYLFNDRLDAEQDRQHPLKALRPIPSGRLSTSLAMGMAVALAVIGLGGAFALDLTFGLMASAYLILTLAYTIRLKHFVVLDVMVIAVGFVMRVGAGALAIDALPSHWLLLCTMLLALFLGFSKRRHELLLLNEGSTQHRPVLEHYSPEFLDQMNSIVMGATIVCYAIYTVSEETIHKFGSGNLIFSVPFVIYGLFRYLYLVNIRDSGGSPADTLLGDRPLAISIVLWAAFCAGVIYFH
ncbi:MAG: decaprenyl-phosphate phosphoribosyltransferase [Acidobacteria bacterium]|nr:decaprenyl-phosphate phosphoribosyltransferase [Acidobacteriota bacterium]